jgi:ligand-binding sensor domain-containing protein
VTVFDGLEKEIVNDVAVDANYLWVASDGGLNRVVLKSIDKDTLEVIEIAPDDLHLVPVYDLEKTENLLWAATDDGAYVFDTAKNTGGYVADVDGPHSEVVTSVSRHENEIWFGTLRSIEAYDMTKKQWMTSPARQVYIPYAVNCLVADSVVVWAGTNQGVMRYNRRTQEWRRYTIEDGLMDNQVNAIAMDGGVVWFGTNSGLTAFRWRAPGRVD